MNENAQKWVSALRSGKFEQTPFGLRQDSGYCCLGVACELYRREVGGRWNGDTFEPSGDDWSASYLPEVVAKWLGLRLIDGGYDDDASLAHQNDSGSSFEEIAGIIESEPYGLFA